jgi:hypothetical protein
MLPNCEAPGRDGNAATGARCSLQERKNSSQNSFPPHRAQAKIRAADPSVSRPRLQHLARRLHSLGPQALSYFLDELSRGRDVVEALEDYAREPYTGLIQAYAVTPGPFLIEGVRE